MGVFCIANKHLLGINTNPDQTEAVLESEPASTVFRTDKAGVQFLNRLEVSLPTFTYVTEGRQQHPPSSPLFPCAPTGTSPAHASKGESIVPVLLGLLRVL